jgi:succinate dehydrogenase / fumarate reductase flavoprotein subunit
MQKEKHYVMMKTFKFVGAWEYKGDDISKEELHKEELKYEVY